ncbi:MAG: hypothetical protein ACYTGS_02650, partial [Planctomycetota bacterium]
MNSKSGRTTNHANGVTLRTFTLLLACLVGASASKADDQQAQSPAYVKQQRRAFLRRCPPIAFIKRP